MKLCRSDSTPLVFTMERPGAEYHCLRCGGWFALFDSVDVEPTDAVVRLADHLTDRFRAGERGPVASIEMPPVVAPSDDHIKCDGCGKDSGRTKAEGKPAVWYERGSRDDVQTACSRACIDIVAERTGKTRVVLPW